MSHICFSSTLLHKVNRLQKKKQKRILDEKDTTTCNMEKVAKRTSTYKILCFKTKPILFLPVNILCLYDYLPLCFCDVTRISTRVEKVLVNSTLNCIDGQISIISNLQYQIRRRAPGILLDLLRRYGERERHGVMVLTYFVLKLVRNCEKETASKIKSGEILVGLNSFEYIIYLKLRHICKLYSLKLVSYKVLKGNICDNRIT